MNLNTNNIVNAAPTTANITYCKSSKKYLVRTQIDGKQKFIAREDTMLEAKAAQRAYKKAVKWMEGEMKSVAKKIMDLDWKSIDKDQMVNGDCPEDDSDLKS